jgi:hypothetical protein
MKDGNRATGLEITFINGAHARRMPVLVEFALPGEFAARVVKRDLEAVHVQRRRPIVLQKKVKIQQLQGAALFDSRFWR